MHSFNSSHTQALRFALRLLLTSVANIESQEGVGVGDPGAVGSIEDSALMVASDAAIDEVRLQNKKFSQVWVYLHSFVRAHTTIHTYSHRMLLQLW